MDKVTDSYLNNEVNDEAVIAWIQGNISSQEDQNHIDMKTIGISSYAEHFTDKLHQSFDWLLKLAVNVPLTRTPFLSNKKSSSLTEDFQVFLNKHRAISNCFLFSENPQLYRPQFFSFS